MMTPEDLKAAKLRENPFRLLPDVKVTIWAGHHDLKRTLINTVTSVRNDKVGISEFVVLQGELGTGKSHALRYLETLINSTEASDYGSMCVYLETIRVSDKMTFLDLYRAIVSKIDRGTIKQLAESLVATVAAEYKTLRSATPEKEFKDIGKDDVELRLKSRAVSRVFGKAEKKYGLFEHLAKDSGEAWFFLSAAEQRFKPETLSRFGVTGPIASDFDAVTHLGMLINLACGAQLTSGQTFWKAFYLFVDEVELMEMDPKAIISVNHGFRDILNACSEHLCLIFGFTGDAAYVETLLATGLLDRMTRPPLALPVLDETQGIGFLKEVLNAYRTSTEGIDEWHPFTQEAIKYIVLETTDKTPRNLFRNARKILDKAAGEGILMKGKISKEDAERLIV